MNRPQKPTQAEYAENAEYEDSPAAAVAATPFNQVLQELQVLLFQLRLQLLLALLLPAPSRLRQGSAVPRAGQGEARRGKASRVEVEATQFSVARSSVAVAIVVVAAAGGGGDAAAPAGGAPA